MTILGVALDDHPHDHDTGSMDHRGEGRELRARDRPGPVPAALSLDHCHQEPNHGLPTLRIRLDGEPGILTPGRSTPPR